MVSETTITDDVNNDRHISAHAVRSEATPTTTTTTTTHTHRTTRHKRRHRGAKENNTSDKAHIGSVVQVTEALLFSTWKGK